MRKFQKYIGLSLGSCVIFSAGAFVGGFYSDFDFLCDKASPHILTADMTSESGIIFPKGTVVPLRHCAYRKRFEWEFAMAVSAKTDTAEVVVVEEYGFSLLEVDE